MVKLFGCNKVILSCHDNAPVLLLGREHKEQVAEGMAHLVLSDVDGNLSIWELKARVTR